MRLEFVHPVTQLRDVWDELRPQLDRLREKQKETWRAEDVWMALQLNKASLFRICADNGNTLGWIVLETIADAGETKPVLHVWIGIGLGLLVEMPWLVDQVDAIAKEIGAGKVRFTSPRRGWEKTMRAFFEMKRVVWEREVQS